MLPTPDEPMLYLPGLAFTCAMNSFMVADRHRRMHGEEQRRGGERRDRRDVLRIVRHLGIELRIDRQDRAIGDHERRAVGRRAGQASTAMPPLAPERFSTTMVWLRRSCIRLPTMRATVSGSPPAGCVMMNLMVGAVRGLGLAPPRRRVCRRRAWQAQRARCAIGTSGLLRPWRYLGACAAPLDCRGT